MTEFTEAETGEIAGAFLIANTPGSFQRWLERSVSVSRMSAELSEDQLLDKIQQNLRAERTEVTAAKAYAYLVALILRRRRAGGLGNMPIVSESLRWAQPMWDFAKRRLSTTSNILIDSHVHPTVKVQQNVGHPLLVDQQGNPLRRVD